MGVREIIFQEICTHGPIPFSRFMELALYCPDYGLYEKEADTVGRSGDFYTSVSVGSLFGELLAFDFAAKLAGLETRNPGIGMQIIEAGAHDGKLARDVLSWLRGQRPQLYEHLGYVVVEPSKRRRQWQESTLAEFGGKVCWLDRLPHPQFSGVLFANELLDAFSVRRVGWDAKARQWFEWGVDADNGQFVWSPLRLTDCESANVSQTLDCQGELHEVLPDGFTTEISPAATTWWAAAAKALTSGYLVTSDYGLTADEFLQPQRMSGTLRSYHRHQLIPDVLA